MSENQARVTLQSFLHGSVLRQYDAMGGMMQSTEESITYNLEAVQYSLVNYAQAKDIAKAIQDLCDTIQKPEKDEKQYCAL